MKSRRIMRLSWQNYKGLGDGVINADGRDVIISGRNGAGKSSIAGLLAFALFGADKGSAKRFDESGSVIADITPAVEVEFDDGTILRREIARDNKTRLFVNGVATPVTKFNAFIDGFTNGAGSLILNPFEFVNLHWNEQRNFLLRNFGTSERPTIDDLPLEVFRSKCNGELKNLKREVAGIPFQIDELQRQLREVPETTTTELGRQVRDKTVELAKLQRHDDAEQLSNAKQTLANLQRDKSYLERDLRTAQAGRQRLLKVYREMGTACPMCGAVLSPEKLKAARVPVVRDGKKAAAQITELEGKLAGLNGQIKTATSAVEELEKNYPRDLDERRAAIQAELADIQKAWALLDNADKLKARVETLTARERELNARIVELEGKLAEADALQWRLMQESEDAVNSRFSQVTFKLFYKQVNGEVKETCEAMIGGVPYSSLSKGEKLKAALDILNAVQNHFGLKMPLVIDDAESYTANSFVDLDNQLLLCKVAESDLKVAIDEGRKAA